MGEVWTVKKLLLLCLTLASVSTAMIGGTLAGFSTQTEQEGVTQITTKSLSIGIKEEKQEIYIEGNAKPGDTIYLPRNIINSEENGYDCYTRVTIYKRWNRDGLDSGKIHLYLGDSELTVENKEEIGSSNWILWHQDEEQVVMYYRKPLATKEASSEVLSALLIDADIDNSYADAQMILEFEVDAVQKIAAKDAMVAEWGVYPTFDANGYLVSISE